MVIEYTPIAFITGIVRVLGLPNDFLYPTVKVAVSATREEAHSNNNDIEAEDSVNVSGIGERYRLVVRPGRWMVRARFGIVQSADKIVEVGDGEMAAADFVFGKPRKS
jgi:hypothetical protein